MRYSFPDSHEAFIRDDPSLLQFMMRTPQRGVRTVSRTQASTNGPTNDGLHIPRMDERTYESFTQPIPVPLRQGHPSHSVTLPSTGRFGSLLTEDADLTRRSIVPPLNPAQESNMPTVTILRQPQQAHASNFATLLDTGQFGYLLSEEDNLPRRSTVVASLPVPLRQGRPSHSATLPSTGRFVESLFSEEADLTRRSIVPLHPSLGLIHTETYHQDPHPASFATKEFGSLLPDDEDDDDDAMTPIPIRPSSLLLESTRGLPSQDHLIHLAKLPHTSQVVGSPLFEAVPIETRLAISQELPQRSTATRARMSVASLEPSQLNQKNDNDDNAHEDDTLSIETIDYLDAVTLQPDDPWKPP